MVSAFKKTQAAFALMLAGVMVFASVPLSFANTGVPTFTFNGDGYGHGVGMSQMGAIGMSKAGFSADAIMKHYFQGTQVSTINLNKRALVHLDTGKAARSSWTLRVGAPGGVNTVRGANGATQRFGDGAVRFLKSGTGVRVVGNGVDRVFASPVTVTPDASPAPLIQVVDSGGPFGYTNARYRGHMIVTSTSSGVTLVNSLSIQDYLRGVVPAEIGSFAKSQPAALQAQAIAARSYAYSAINGGTAMYCTVSNQVYKGHSLFRTEADRVANKPVMFEFAEANAAIDATNNKYVTYNGNVITTYFSSCNGSYTANVNDVWGSTQHQYYSSVKESYCSHSDHNWTKAYTGYELATQLKNKGVSAPAGAGSTVYVKSLKPTYGTNGWVRALTVTYSNGATATINRGDNVRIKLGLRSARFQIVTSGDTATVPVTPPGGNPVTPPADEPTTPPADNPVTPPADKPTPPPAGALTPVVVNRYEQNNAVVKKIGNWSTFNHSGNSGGSIVISKTLGNAVEMKFKGSGIAWIGPKAATYGQAKVFIDGQLKETVNVYRFITQRQLTLFQITGLDQNVEHTIRIEVANSAGGGTPGNIGIDRFDVTSGGLPLNPEPAPEPVKPPVEEPVNPPTEDPATPPVEEPVTPPVDEPGTPPVEDPVTPPVDEPSGPPLVEPSHPPVDEPVVPPVEDPVTPPVEDPKPPVEEPVTPPAEVEPTPPPKLSPVVTTRYEQNSAAIRKVGTWVTRNIPGNSGGSIITSKGLGNYVEMKFKGSKVSWIGPKAATYGAAKVYIDGQYKKTIDVYRFITQRQLTLFTQDGLDPTKEHTIRIEVAKPAGKAVGNIGIDRIDVTSGGIPVSGTPSTPAPQPPVTPEPAPKPLVPADQITMYTERSPYALRFGRGWNYTKNRAYQGGEAVYTTTKDSGMEFKFSGREFRLVGKKGSYCGRVHIYLNNRYVGTYNLQTSLTNRSTLLYSVNNLDPTKVNTVKVVNVPRANGTMGEFVYDYSTVRGGTMVK